MKKILLILLIGCTLQCIAQHHRDFDTEKEFLEFFAKKGELHIYIPKEYFNSELKSDWINTLSKYNPNIKYEINTLENYLK